MHCNEVPGHDRVDIDMTAEVPGIWVCGLLQEICVPLPWFLPKLWIVHKQVKAVVIFILSINSEILAPGLTEASGKRAPGSLQLETATVEKEVLVLGLVLFSHFSRAYILPERFSNHVWIITVRYTALDNPALPHRVLRYCFLEFFLRNIFAHCFSVVLIERRKMHVNRSIFGELSVNVRIAINQQWQRWCLNLLLTLSIETGAIPNTKVLKRRCSVGKKIIQNTAEEPYAAYASN